MSTEQQSNSNSTNGSESEDNKKKINDIKEANIEDSNNNILKEGNNLYKNNYNNDIEEKKNTQGGNIIIHQNTNGTTQEKEKTGMYNTYSVKNDNFLGIHQNNDTAIKTKIDSIEEQLKDIGSYFAIPTKAFEDESKIKTTTAQENKKLTDEYNKAIEEYCQSVDDVEKLSCKMLTKLLSNVDINMHLCQDDYYDFTETYNKYKKDIDNLSNKYKKQKVLDYLKTFKNSIDNISIGQITDEDNITTTTNQLYQQIFDDYVNFSAIKKIWLKICDLFQLVDHNTATHNFLLLCKNFNQEMYKYNKGKTKQERDPYIIKMSSLVSQMKEAAIYMPLTPEQNDLLNKLSNNIIGLESNGLARNTIDMSKFINSTIKAVGANITNKSLQIAMQTNKKNMPTIINKLKTDFKQNIDYNKLNIDGKKKNDIIQKTLSSYFDIEDKVGVEDIKKIVINSEGEETDEIKKENQTTIYEIKKNIYGNSYDEKIKIDQECDFEQLKHNAFLYSNNNQQEIDIAKKKCIITQQNLLKFKDKLFLINKMISEIESLNANSNDFNIEKNHMHDKYILNLQKQIEFCEVSLLELEDNLQKNIKAKLENGKCDEIEKTKEDKNLNDKKKGAKYLLEQLLQLKEDDNTECDIVSEINKRLNDCKNVAEERVKNFGIFKGAQKDIVELLKKTKERLEEITKKFSKKETTIGKKIEEIREKEHTRQIEIIKENGEIEKAKSDNFEKGVKLALTATRKDSHNHD